MSEQTRLKHWLMLIVIVIGSFFLRIENIEFGLPHFFHNDEIHKIAQINHYLTGDLHPPKLYHPTFLTYSSALIIATYEELAEVRLPDYERLLLARFWIAFLGTMTSVALFFVARYFGSTSLGIIAALLLSIMPLHVLCSHYVKEDVPLVFWLTIALGFFLRFARERKLYLSALSGFFSGLASSTKYFALICIFIFIIELILLYGLKLWQRQIITSLSLFIVLFLLGFLLLTPYALLDYRQFRRESRREFRHSLRGHERQPISPWRYAWTFHLQNSLIPGVTLPLLLLSIAGIPLAFCPPPPVSRLSTLRLNSREVKILFIIFLLFYLLIEGSPLKPPPNYERFALPFLPLLALFGAYAMLCIFNLSPKVLLKVNFIFLFILVSFFALRKSILTDLAMSPDTRETATFWILRHLPLKAKILVVGRKAYQPQISEMSYRIEKGSEDCEGFLEPGFLDRFDYIIVSSFLYERHFGLYPKKTPAYYFYRFLFDQGKLIREFPPRNLSYGFHNPTLRIYQSPKT